MHLLKSLLSEAGICYHSNLQVQSSHPPLNKIFQGDFSRKDSDKQKIVIPLASLCNLLQTGYHFDICKYFNLISHTRMMCSFAKSCVLRLTRF